ncbi:hypothetical protein Hanom_Chr16g01432121 [Helianthus anomalus]
MGEKTYSADKKFWNNSRMRSRPCLTRRRLRVWLPCDFTVLFFRSKSTTLLKVLNFFDASRRSPT